MNAQNGVIIVDVAVVEFGRSTARQAANRKLHMTIEIMVAIQRYLEIRFFAHRNGLRGRTSSNGKVRTRGRIPFESGNRTVRQSIRKNLPMPVDAEGVAHLRNVVRIITETGLRVYKELMPVTNGQVDLA